MQNNCSNHHHQENGRRNHHPSERCFPAFRNRNPIKDSVCIYVQYICNPHNHIHIRSCFAVFIIRYGLPRHKQFISQFLLGQFILFPQIENVLSNITHSKSPHPHHSIKPDLCHARPLLHGQFGLPQEQLPLPINPKSGRYQGYRPLFYSLRIPPLAALYRWGTCQILSAYSVTARSAANTPLRAMLCRLIVFHFAASA